MKCQVVAGDLLCVWLDHDVAVNEDGADDGEWEEWMSENMNGNPGEIERSEPQSQSRGSMQCLTFWSDERVIVNTKLFLQKT